MRVAEPHGSVAPGFEPVREAFAAVLRQQRGGAGLAVWHDGGWVVDLWGGVAVAGVAGDRPWEADTLVMPYSVSKPYVAAAALVLVDRGVLDLDMPLQVHWPGLAAPTTLRHVLAHRSGLVHLDEPAPEASFYDWDDLCGRLARQRPAWEPGDGQGESALFMGHLVGEVLRRVDGRSLGRVLRDEVCGPYDLDFHVGLTAPELARTADLVGFGPGFWPPEPGSRPDLYTAAVTNPPGALAPGVVNSERWRRAEVPAVNGHGTARSVAGLYVALQHGGLLGPGLLDEVRTTAGPAYDQVLGDEREWGLGVIVEAEGYGMGGMGGSVGWWNGDGGYALGFVTSHLDGFDRADLLEAAVADVLA